MIHLSQFKFLKDSFASVFGRVVYTHKTQEKCADILLKRLSQIKLWQIGLSVVTTGGFISTFFGAETIGSIIGSSVSAIFLGLTLYTKDYNLAELAQKHRQAASDIWVISRKISVVNYRPNNRWKTIGDHTARKGCLDGGSSFSLLWCSKDHI